jgi:xylitol oxidase
MATNGTPINGLTNWAGNIAYGARRLYEPESLEQLQEIVRSSNSLRVLGSRHSFNTITDSAGDLVSLVRMPRVFELDETARTVTVDGGVRYGDLCAPLNAAGYALHNLASLPHISVAGACATATHGSGNLSGNLATAVVALDVVTADGELVSLSRERDPDVFPGAVVALGGLGAVTALTLQLQPAFQMRQDLYEHISLDEVARHFDEIYALADSVSLFSEWVGPGFEQLWLKRRVVAGDPFQPPAEVFGATRATETIHPIRRMPSDACTPQLGVPGPWYERMPHFLIDRMPSSGSELQTEYLLPREHAVEALLAIAGLRTVFQPVLQVAEVRTVAADDLWLSTAYGRPSVALHFTWLRDPAAVERITPLIEAALAPFDPRPHWGKVFTMAPAAVRAAYPRLAGFVDLLQRHDPNGTFRNRFLDEYIFGV